MADSQEFIIEEEEFEMEFLKMSTQNPTTSKYNYKKSVCTENQNISTRPQSTCTSPSIFKRLPVTVTRISKEKIPNANLYENQAVESKPSLSTILKAIQELAVLTTANMKETKLLRHEIRELEKKNCTCSQRHTENITSFKIPCTAIEELHALEAKIKDEAAAKSLVRLNNFFLIFILIHCLLRKIWCTNSPDRPSKNI